MQRIVKSRHYIRISAPSLKVFIAPTNFVHREPGSGGSTPGSARAEAKEAHVFHN
ncbi:hypothetical protein LguiA_012943 [Lonicera macranthoides]